MKRPTCAPKDDHLARWNPGILERFRATDRTHCQNRASAMRTHAPRDARGLTDKGLTEQLAATLENEVLLRKRRHPMAGDVSSGGGGNCARDTIAATQCDCNSRGKSHCPWSEMGRVAAAQSPELLEVLEKWPLLPAHIVQAILALVRASAL